jgi:TatD DNase family protein
VLIDAHAHLDRYGDRLDAALQEIDARRILTVTVSMDLPSWDRNREIAARSRFVTPAFGIHPWNAPDYFDRLEEVARAAAEAPMLGEIGLDHYFVENDSAHPAQREVFAFLLSAAARDGKIVNIHTKGAERQVLDMLDRSAVERVIVHWYSGPVAPLRGLIERGAFFTVGPEILHSEETRGIARMIPEDLLLTETDNPGGLEWLIGAPGMPVAVVEVVAALAELRGTTPDDIETTVERNAARLLKGDERLADALALLGAGAGPAHAADASPGERRGGAPSANAAPAKGGSPAPEPGGGQDL